MKNKNRFQGILIVAIIIALSSFSAVEKNKDSADHSAVRQAVLNYVEGVYEVDTTKIYRSVHPDLVKRGIMYSPRKGNYVPAQDMNFNQMIALTRSWNKNKDRADINSVKEVVIFDVQDMTASAKVTAVWGIDYFHLSKEEGKWYIRNVLWQSLRPAQGAARE